jgi:hypothetical protein
MNFIMTFEKFDLIKVSDVMLGLRDLAYELDDEGVNWRLEPDLDNDIRKNILSFYLRKLLDESRKDIKFFLDVMVDKPLTDKTKRSGMFSAPEWFIDFLQRVIDYMDGFGFKTFISVRIPSDVVWIDDLEELSEWTGLAYSIRLEFDLVK